jgi:hypothetical protein
MKRKNQITQAVLAANKMNAQKSSGPRTPQGKQAAKRSAITHGFFGQELVLNDEETRQLETICRTLHPQLSPARSGYHVQSLREGRDAGLTRGR